MLYFLTFFIYPIVIFSIINLSFFHFQTQFNESPDNIVNIGNVSNFSSNVTGSYLLPGGTPGTEIPYRYVIHLKNITTIGSSPSNFTEGNVTAKSFADFLQRNNIEVYFTFDRIGGLAMELPKEIPVMAGPSPSNTSSNKTTTLLDIFSIFAGPSPSNETQNINLKQLPTNSTEVCNIIMLNPNVESCIPEAVGAPSSIVSSSSTRQTLSTGFKRIGGLNLSGANNLSSSNVTIAIVDTGVSFHDDLNIVERISFVGDVDDHAGHGTHVAGIAAAVNNSEGIVGVAPGVKLLSLKVLDKCPENNCWVGGTSTFQAAAEYIANHASEIDVANWSVDLVSQNDPNLNDLIDSAVAQGVVTVIAAGNFNRDVSMSSPPDSRSAIIVSAMADTDGECGGYGPPASNGNPDDSFAKRSNYGQGVVIAAPGIDIYSTWIDNSYHLTSGTSMAAPYVSGAAALYIAHHSNVTPSEVRDALLSSAVTDSTLCNTDGYGYLVDRRYDSDGRAEPLLNINNLLQ